MRSIALILFLFATVMVATAENTNDLDPITGNYRCIVCGKSPLYGQIWRHPRGLICDECEKIKDRCTICGLPVKEGDGHLKTGDGRFICKFDKPNVVMTTDQATELFEKVRDEVVDLYGPQFALKNTQVTVTMFDVDYWSEKGRTNGLHTYGFAHSRPAEGDHWTHEVIMLSGRTRDEMTGVAAHEYTHLWINENRPANHKIDGDTVEAICELTAYKLMQQKRRPDMEKRILDNPYTDGKIKTLVAVEREGGTDYVLNWVKNSQAETFDEDASLAPLPALAAPVQVSALPPVLPAGLKFSGIMTLGKLRQAVINGTALGVGDQKRIKLRDKTVSVRCREIRDDEVVVELNDSPAPATLSRGKEVLIP
ncbi:MAG TPA: hypothetical protein VK815_14435 [Candidatus Acidoferrales bacterium]|nr:hypothetical protein [Candidatus Acidoferrales bacterium]